MRTCTGRVGGAAERVNRQDARIREAHRKQRRALYRRRRLMAVAVLGALFLGIGFLWSAFFGGGAEQRVPMEAAGEVRSSGMAPAVYRHSPDGTPSAGGVRTSLEGEPAGGASDEGGRTEPPETTSKSLYVLVLGVDRRPDTPEDSSSRSDTMILVKVTPETGHIKLLSVPRDLLVEVEPGVEDRINQAYAHGGTDRAKAVMENLTGVHIDRYAIVDFEGFEEVIDALGAVRLEVREPIRLGIEGQRVYIPAGTQELNGLEALAYARYRGTACGDLDRIERQQQLAFALRAEALTWNTITQLPKIVRVINENVETDIGIVQAISIGRTLIRYGDHGGMRSAEVEGEPEVLPNGDAVLVPDERANEAILERFRSDEPAPRRPGHGPRRGGSSGC